MRVAAAILILGALGACASGGAPRGQSDYDRLVLSCQARGGILVPSGGPLTGRVETDNVCRITGPASRTRR